MNPSVQEGRRRRLAGAAGFTESSLIRRLSAAAFSSDPASQVLAPASEAAASSSDPAASSASTSVAGFADGWRRRLVEAAGGWWMPAVGGRRGRLPFVGLFFLFCFIISCLLPLVVVGCLVFGGGFARTQALVLEFCLSLSGLCWLSFLVLCFRRPGSGAQWFATVATFGVFVDGKGGPGFSQGMCFSGIAPYRSEDCERHVTYWSIGGDSGPLLRFVRSAPLRAPTTLGDF